MPLYHQDWQMATDGSIHTIASGLALMYQLMIARLPMGGFSYIK